MARLIRLGGARVLADTPNPYLRLAYLQAVTRMVPTADAHN